MYPGRSLGPVTRLPPASPAASSLHLRPDDQPAQPRPSDPHRSDAATPPPPPTPQIVQHSLSIVAPFHQPTTHAHPLPMMADSDSDNDHHGIGGGWAFLIAVVLILLLAAGAWTLYTRLRARRLGLPPPPLNPFSRGARGAPSRYSASPSTGLGGGGGGGGPLGWLGAQVRALRNRRSAAGAYESASGGGGGGGGGGGARRGRAPLDPDEAWDSRVGNEADVYGPGGYYEEQELGLRGPAAYGGGGSGGSGGGGGGGAAAGLSFGDEGRARSGSRERALDRRYDEEMGRAGRAGAGLDPFGEGAERSDISLRGVSPRPIDTERKGHEPAGSADGSPSERRSMFRENV